MCRKLKNFSPDLAWSTKVGAVNRLMVQMFQMEHSEAFRETVARRIVANYTNALELHVAGEKPLYRTKVERETHKSAQGGGNTSSGWFRKSAATNVLWVPATKGGALARSIKGKLEDCSAPRALRSIVVEKPGSSIGNVLGKGNPFPKKSCGRRSCPWVIRGEDCRMQCFKEGLAYFAFCRFCLEEDRKKGIPEDQVELYAYLGETHRSLPTRRLTQMARKSSNWMHLHNVQVHMGDANNWTEAQIEEQFEFRPIHYHRNVLDRQVDEYVLINRAESEGLVNSGGNEYKVRRSLLNTKFEFYGTRGYRMEDD